MWFTVNLPNFVVKFFIYYNYSVNFYKINMSKHKELDRLCRLCLKESDTVEDIFETNDGNSLVLRLMASVSLEVHKNDNLPKSICPGCRYQLEKTYIFRNRCQNNDIKLRRHVKMLAAGKICCLLDDLEDDENVYEQSMEFIRKFEKANELKKEHEWRHSILKAELQALRNLEKSTNYEEVRQDLPLEHGPEKLDAGNRGLPADFLETEDKSLTVKIEPVKEPIVVNFKSAKHVIHAVSGSIQQDLQVYAAEEDHSKRDLDTVVQDSISCTKEETPMDIDAAENSACGNANTVLNETLLASSNHDNIAVSEIPPVTDRFVITEVSDSDTDASEDDLEREEHDLYGSDADSDEDMEAVTNAVKAELAQQPGFKIGENCVMNVEKDGNLTKVEVRADDGSVICMEFSMERKPKTMPSVEAMQADMAGIFNCDQCSLSFKNARLLTSHIRTGHNDVAKGHVCDVCQKWFPVKSALERHYRIHTGEKPFVCAVCNRSFVQKEILKRHLLIHTNVSVDIRQYTVEKPFLCEHCPQRYNQKEQLKNHVMKKHKENPASTTIHKCNMCDKEFKYSSGLSRHVPSHFGRTFPCHCGRAFKDKSALKRHESSVHVHSKNDTDKEASNVATTVNELAKE